MSDATVATEQPKEPAENSVRDPLRDVLERMNRAREHVATIDPHLSDTIRLLAERADQPGRIESINFRTRVAYALQDLEKLAGPVANMNEPMRHEMARLATTMPGLQNERLQELMRRTPEIQDVGLVRDIRVVAADTTTRTAQDTASIRDWVDALESKVRLSSGATEGRRATFGPAGKQVTSAASGQPQPRAGMRTDPNSEQRAQTAPPNGNPPQEEGRRRMGAAQPGWKEGERDAQQAPAAQAAPNGVQIRAPGLVASIMSAINQPAAQGPQRSALDPSPTPMAERVSRFEQRMQEGREENSFRDAEQSGRAALEALQAFANGPGAGVMNRIRDAAKADPGGMAGVMSEMRAGGVYADLRQQFDGAMVKEKGFAAAYERAVAATGQYAKDRTMVEAIISQRPDVEALTGRFQKLDAQLGEAAVSTPGRKEGNNALEELAEKAAEIISRAVDRVKAAFSSSARASSSPSPSP